MRRKIEKKVILRVIEKKSCFSLVEREVARKKKVRDERELVPPLSYFFFLGCNMARCLKLVSMTKKKLERLVWIK